MASLHFFVISLSLLISLTSATWGRYGGGLPEGAQLGDTCTPRGSPRRCGEKILLNSTETPLNETTDGFGPNVCRVTSMYMQQTVGYTYQQYCRFRFCRSGCYATNMCNGTMVNFTKTTEKCCDGFAQGESMDSSLSRHFSFFRNHRKSNSLRTEGCPIMLQENLLDCLADLNLSELLAEILQLPDLVARLGSSDSDPVTIFAPSNLALANLDDITRNLLFGDLARETSILAHIGDGNLPQKKFNHGTFIETLAPNITVHIGKTRNGTVKQYYVNGVRISQTNACQARNGIVHIIDDVIPFSSATINDILIDQSSRFGTFLELAKAAGIDEPLDDLKKSRTLFAPVDDAFDQRLVDCLLREENENYLNHFVLIHISYPAEFISTLSQRQYVPTFTYWYLTINADNNQVTVTRDEIAIEDADIPASNGVVHAISSIIQPFSDSKLERICPEITSTMAPTTPEPTPEPTDVVVVDPEATADPDGIPPGGLVVDPDTVS